MRACAALLLLLCAGAHAEESEHTRVSGSLRLSYFSSSRDLNDVANVLGLTGSLKVQHELNERQRVELETRWLGTDVARSLDDELRLVSAFWLARWDRVDLRVGQQKVRWGKADGINPTDFFTPSDFSVLLPLEDDRYRSVPAVRTDVHVSGNDSVSFVLVPHFTASRIPWPKPSPVPVSEDQPSGWRHPQYGVRWSHTAENLDWSLSAFDGFSTLPLWVVQGPQPDGTVQWSRHYPSAKGLGADLARNFGKIGFRAELAYTHLDGDAERAAARSNYFLVSGVDRSLNDWNFNVQGMVRFTPGYRPASPFAAEQNAIAYGQQHRLMYGMTARVVADWSHQTLQTEVLAVSWLNPASIAIRPLLTYALTDRRKLRFGGEFYAGPALSYFGALERNRTAFLEFQQFF